MSDEKQNLLLFFERPSEPMFMAKGINQTRFQMPHHYIPDEYKHLVKPPPSLATAKSLTITPLAQTLSEVEVKNRIIDVEEITLPDLSIPKQMSKDEQFSFFIPRHRKIAGKLIDIFMNIPTLKELQSLLLYCQMNLNSHMFNYCISVAILHRPDTKGINIPNFVETFPGNFVDQKTMNLARAYSSLASDECEVKPIEIKFEENPKNPEQLLAYFREDVGINSHHWHWHLIYPVDATDTLIVKKDRRGELFYYMHHQIVARYNAERLCNGLARTKPYVNFREKIDEGYFPILNTMNSSRVWPLRFEGVRARNLSRASMELKVTIDELEDWRKNIVAAIESQSILQLDGSILKLDEETGIDILGNLIEATAISENPVAYGDYHNTGHMFIAYIHDPVEFHGQQHSVMGSTETAMRDPVFYRWHANVDNLFTMYKNKLQPYGPEQLVFPSVVVSTIDIDGVSGHNTINTLWERSTVNVKNGLDFAPNRDVFVQFTHLQHEEFTYTIKVANTSSQKVLGTFRIFMAPTLDEAGNPLSLDDQRLHMIEMDKFTHSLDPGNNFVHRHSVDSSVTIPFERIFRDTKGKSNPSSETNQTNFCDCGWPQYLLVPKGTVEGYPMVLFVMVSNWKEDKVERELTGANNDNASYCGLRDLKYPDRRPMGFPFDRKMEARIEILSDFLQPNMAFKNCTIKFTNRTRDRVAGDNQSKKQCKDCK